MKRLLITVIVLFSAGGSAAQDVDHGGELYLSFCSTCHGLGGRGDGGMGPILTVLPADLTRLSRANDGVFPIARVARQIDGRDPLLAHGGAMPLFGEFFTREEVATKTETGQPMITSPEIVDLIAFLEAIQTSD